MLERTKPKSAYSDGASLQDHATRLGGGWMIATALCRGRGSGPARGKQASPSCQKPPNRHEGDGNGARMSSAPRRHKRTRPGICSQFTPFLLTWPVARRWGSHIAGVAVEARNWLVHPVRRCARAAGPLQDPASPGSVVQARVETVEFLRFPGLVVHLHPSGCRLAGESNRAGAYVGGLDGWDWTPAPGGLCRDDWCRSGGYCSP